MRVPEQPLSFRSIGWRCDFLNPACLAPDAGRRPAGRRYQAVAHPEIDMVLTTMPDGSCTLTLPQFTSLQSSEVSNLLQDVVQSADADALAPTWCLLSTDQSLEMEPGLLRHGFEKLVHIQRSLRDPVPAGTPSSTDLTLLHFQLEPAARAAKVQMIPDTLSHGGVDRRSILRLLDILLKEHGLSGPRPSTAEQMIHLWSLMSPRVRMTVLCSGRNPAGLLVVSDPENAEHPTIEFLGIDNRHRRSGAATLMLSHLTTALQVYVDCKNVPANALYAKCGFESRDRFDLWLRTSPGVSAPG